MSLKLDHISVMVQSIEKSIPYYDKLLEIIGFVLLSLTAGRNPYSSLMAYEDHTEDKLSKLRNKVIPDKYVIRVFLIGFICVAIGLFLQLSWLPE